MNLTEEDFAIQLKQLQELVDSNSDDPFNHFNLGKLLWERGEEWREKAAEKFLMAAKLNPQNGEAFRFLGHYYSCVNFDIPRALKCYQRAVSLNPDDSDSGEALCNLLDKEGKESLEVAVCREASGKSPRAFWAFSRLGFLLVHQKKWSEAVQSLQYAIRGNPTCADLWEALGLAYQRLGMYTAAIKSYGRAIELDNSRVFALIETGNILLMLGSYRKGIEHFQHAMEICPQSASAQYGLASGLLSMSQECIKQGAFSWATSLLEDASKIAESSTALIGNMPCVWKLHADIQLTYAKSFPWTESGKLEGEESFSKSLLSWRKTRHIAATSAKCSYQRALHLTPWRANIYMDVAVAVELICSTEVKHKDDQTSWKLAEKMLLGSLLLEGENHEFWMALGCISCHKALRQHAFIRGLHLDVSLASAWAYLGKVFSVKQDKTVFVQYDYVHPPIIMRASKVENAEKNFVTTMLYKEEGESQLGRRAFDRARSIDPSLALPWAGMSAEIYNRERVSDEAYDSCLRAVQIMPLAEFQIGLAKLALCSSHLLSPEVFAATRQALQCAPWYPETHNLNGLVSEGRHDYHSAVASYQLARYAWKTSTVPLPPSHYVDISVNLARALYKEGNVQSAVRELEDLKERGLFDAEGLQVYAISLWKLGKNGLALSAAEDLATCIPTMKLSSAVASVCLICSLLCSISGSRSTINRILNLPTELLQSAKVSFFISALDAIDQSSQLQGVVSTSRRAISSQEEIMEMHLLISLSKLIRNEYGQPLNIQRGIDHLRKALHMYPNGTSLRNMLGCLLLSRKQRENDHVVQRICAVVPFDRIKRDLRLAHEIIGAEAVACHATTTCNSKYFISTCKYQSMQGASLKGLMQRWYRLEPWNQNARYLLVLNLIQTARQARYPQHLMSVLKRITSAALTNQLFCNDTSERYKRFQLLLCSSELSLLGGDTSSCVSLAREASGLSLSDAYTFFAHLQLCRAHAAEDNHTSLNEEFTQCLKLRTDYPIGWISLMIIESYHRTLSGSTFSDLGFRDSIKESNESDNSWLAVYNLFCGLVSRQAQDFLRAEEFISKACSFAATECCFFLCHGVICMELARKESDSQYLTMCIRSLKKAQELSSLHLPFVSLLLAQAEASFGSKLNWDRNLRIEWYSWSPETRPAELYFQMHLLAQRSETTLGADDRNSPKWVLRAIHLNPSCSRYWRVLQKLAE